VLKPDALESLKNHSWQGNIRELMKTCERLSQNASGIVDSTLVKRALTQGSPSAGNHSAPSKENWDNYVLENGLKSLITEIEKRAVEEALKRNNGKITACIKELKISSSAFYRILQDHQLSI
jgi:DNA-binding NtrC family response regulator